VNAAVQVVGFCAAVLSTAQSWPQVYRVWTRKSAEDISQSWIRFTAAAACLWILYGVSYRAWAMVLADTSILLAVLALNVLKRRYTAGRELRPGVARRGPLRP